MLTLYRDHNAVCCHKVELALFEKGLEFESRTVPLFRSAQFEPAYLKINPSGVVPTLVHDGRTIIESTVICEYLDETFPDRPLMPADTAERAQVRQWTKLVDEEIHEAGSVLSFCAMFRDRMLAADEADREKRFRNVGNPSREAFYRSAVEQGVASPFAYRAIAAFERLARDLESRLATTGEWIAGGRYSLAEVAVTPYFARAEYLGVLDTWTAGRPSTAAWWRRIKLRANFVAAIAGTLTGADVTEMRESGGEDRIRDRGPARRVFGRQCLVPSLDPAKENAGAGKLDILIRNARLRGVTDGKSDIAIMEGRIARIPPDLDATAETEIDAAGGLVTESFVNPHLHMCKVDYGDKLPPSPQYIFTPPRRYIFTPPLTQ